MDRVSYNAYQRVYQLRRYYLRKADAIRTLGGKCNYCDSINDLEIDHIDKFVKSFNISRLWSVSKGRFLEELKKCQLLCSTCHAIKSSLENSVGHGGGLTGKKNCYCDKCAPLKRSYMRDNRKSRGKGSVS